MLGVASLSQAEEPPEHCDVTGGSKQTKAGPQAVLGVALLGQADARVNRERLAELLDMQGEFPSRYRPLIWEFLLQLPRNSDAYQVCGCIRGDFIGIQQKSNPAFPMLRESF